MKFSFKRLYEIAKEEYAAADFLPDEISEEEYAAADFLPEVPDFYIWRWNAMNWAYYRSQQEYNSEEEVREELRGYIAKEKKFR